MHLNSVPLDQFAVVAVVVAAVCLPVCVPTLTEGRTLLALSLQ